MIRGLKISELNPSAGLHTEDQFPLAYFGQTFNTHLNGISDMIASLLASNVLPLMDGTANAGISKMYARDDHRHPIDISRAPILSPIFQGEPQANTPPLSDESGRLATTSYVANKIWNTVPAWAMNPTKPVYDYWEVNAAPATHVGSRGQSQHGLATGSTAGFSEANFTSAEKTKLSIGLTINDIVSVPGDMRDKVPSQEAVTRWLTSTTPGPGWMLKTEYDINENGIVDNAEKVEHALTITTVDAVSNTVIYDGSAPIITNIDISNKSNIGHTHIKSNITDFAHQHLAIDITDLAIVASTGNYNDLINLPSIPPIANNGIITITQGGITKGTFTVNQSNNSIISIDAPILPPTVGDGTFTLMHNGNIVGNSFNANSTSNITYTINTIPDAPTDGNLYVRKNNAWVILDIIDHTHYSFNESFNSSFN